MEFGFVFFIFFMKNVGGKEIICTFAARFKRDFSEK